MIRINADDFDLDDLEDQVRAATETFQEISDTLSDMVRSLQRIGRTVAELRAIEPNSGWFEPVRAEVQAEMNRHEPDSIQRGRCSCGNVYGTPSGYGLSEDFNDHLSDEVMEIVDRSLSE